MTNFQKLQDAYTRVGWIKENTFKDKDELAHVAEYIQQLIAEFIVDNEPKKKGTFNIWDYVANDNLRPVMEGVFHDKEKGYAVATDAHILVADKDLYDNSLADPDEYKQSEPFKGMRPVDKYGNLIEGRYPNWSAVIPTNQGNHTKHTISLEELDAYIKKCNTYMKLNGMTGRYKKSINYNVPGTDCWFDANLMRLFLIASGGEINLSDNKHAGVYWGERRTAVIMPLYVDEKSIKETDMGDGIYLR